MKKRLLCYSSLFAVLVLFVHSWVSNSLFWEKIPYRVKAFSLAQTSVNCDHASPGKLADFMKYHTLPNFALMGEVVYINRDGEKFRCYVAPSQKDPLHHYRLASMTKVVTAHAIFDLAQKGILDLDSHLLDYFPEVDASQLRDSKIKAVTLAELANHSSGFGGIFGSDNMVRQGVKSWCPYDFKALETVRLAGVPGTNHVYSNVAYCLLGEVIARVTHSPYRQFVTEYYLSETGLNFVDGGYLSEEPEYDFSNEYKFKRNYVDWLDVQALSSSAGLVGRPDEFARMVWEKVHLDAPALLGGPLVPGCGKDGISTCYSWNFELEFDEQGRVLSGIQQGYMSGVTSMLAITPDGQVLVWVAAGAAIEPQHKDDLRKAVVSFLESQKRSELAFPEAA